MLINSPYHYAKNHEKRSLPFRLGTPPHLACSESVDDRACAVLREKKFQEIPASNYARDYCQSIDAVYPFSSSTLDL